MLCPSSPRATLEWSHIDPFGIPPAVCCGLIQITSVASKLPSEFSTQMPFQRGLRSGLSSSRVSNSPEANVRAPFGSERWLIGRQRSHRDIVPSRVFKPLATTRCAPLVRRIRSFQSIGRESAVHRFPPWANRQRARPGVGHPPPSPLVLRCLAMPVKSIVSQNSRARTRCSLRCFLDRNPRCVAGPRGDVTLNVIRARSTTDRIAR